MLPDPAPEPAEPPRADPAAAPLAPAPAAPDEAARAPDDALPGGRQRAFAYLDTENAARYRQLMGVLLANRRAFGLRLSPAQIATRLWERYATRPDSTEVLERDLEALCGWGALDRFQDSSKASSTREFKRRRFTYDLTAAGEIVERAALQVDRIAERIGALERSQLPELLGALIALAAEAEREEPRPAKLVAGFNDVAAKLERLRADTADFMRELGAVMADEEAVDLAPFERYKRRVIDHLQGFRSELARLDGQFAAAIGRVEAVGIGRVVALAAESDEPPVWGLTEEEVAARRAARLAEEWSAVRRWFRGAEGEAPPWRELDGRLGDAIEWIVLTAQRLIDRRTRRVDRSAEYRALARLFHRAESLPGCHALFAATFGLFQPRHFSIPEEDRELTAPTVSWWRGRPAPVEASLRRPGARAPGPGRAVELPDHAMAREALATARALEREELARARRRFTGGGPLRLDQLARLDALEFRHLLRWLARALDAVADEADVRRAESQDGLVSIELRAPPADDRPVTIATPDGTFTAPNYGVEVRAA